MGKSSVDNQARGTDLPIKGPSLPASNRHFYDFVGGGGHWIFEADLNLGGFREPGNPGPRGKKNPGIRGFGQARSWFNRSANERGGTKKAEKKGRSTEGTPT